MQSKITTVIEHEDCPYYVKLPKKYVEKASKSISVLPCRIYLDICDVLRNFGSYRVNLKFRLAEFSNSLIFWEEILRSKILQKYYISNLKKKITLTRKSCSLFQLD